MKILQMSKSQLSNPTSPKQQIPMVCVSKITHAIDVSNSDRIDPTDRAIVAFKPAPRVKQRLRWRDEWIQFDVEPTSANYDGRSYGGSVTVTLHNSKHAVLQELVMAAREEYLKCSVSKVTVHLSDRVSLFLCFSIVGEFTD